MKQKGTRLRVFITFCSSLESPDPTPAGLVRLFEFPAVRPALLPAYKCGQPALGFNYDQLGTPTGVARASLNLTILI